MHYIQQTNRQLPIHKCGMIVGLYKLTLQLGEIKKLQTISVQLQDLTLLQEVKHLDMHIDQQSLHNGVIIQIRKANMVLSYSRKAF